MRERGIAARDRARHPHHVLGGAGFALARCSRRRTLGAAGKAQPMDFADDRISGHISEFCRNLARRKPGFPELLELFDAIVRPGQYRHCAFSFASRPPGFGVALRCQSSQKSLPAESLSPRRARKSHPNVYAEQLRLRGSVLPHEMSYPTGEKLQYGVTPAQESAAMRPHVPSNIACIAIFCDAVSLRGRRLATG